MKTDLQHYLYQLLDVQTQMLAVLHKQQAILVRPTKETLASISVKEEEALAQMQGILNRREELLTSARLQNIHGDSIEQLCDYFFPHNIEIQKLLNEARSRAQQIQLLAYTNWTLDRKSLIHVSQILELLQTRGQGKTTYQPQMTASASGGYSVDRVA